MLNHVDKEVEVRNEINMSHPLQLDRARDQWLLSVPSDLLIKSHPQSPRYQIPFQSLYSTQDSIFENYLFYATSSGSKYLARPLALLKLHSQQLLSLLSSLFPKPHFRPLQILKHPRHLFIP